MSYTVHFFAHNGNHIAQRLRTEPDEVVRQVEAWAKKEKIRRATIDTGLKYVRRICQADFGSTCRVPFFDAFCWIGDALMERITIPEFSELKSYRLIGDSGIHPALHQFSSPYPQPTAANDQPLDAGFVPWNQMAQFQFGDDGLKPADDVIFARQQLLDVLETLIEDQLDLLVIVN